MPNNFEKLFLWNEDVRQLIVRIFGYDTHQAHMRKNFEIFKNPDFFKKFNETKLIAKILVSNTSGTLLLL